MKMHEINELSLEEIKQRLEDALEELSNLRFQKALGQLSNPLRLRIVRRDIARLKTVIREYELGIRKQTKSIEEKV
ncbi:50S ribosomal protein L29 [candidate division KSB1 bacterium]|nr:50S ribosomal protein L29 [bacterium]OQX59223.1 MAG: 50S ribosomal protein L29 [candidate division KSB1 bacterium 4484_219]RKY80095.1 MAG: 50S ribosomal protein L29 [candidate division KSB1 bacterium]HDI51265.1 50S ribosomal protein L29 [Bacteroidota bacterium]RKY81129.1 MAG: 50S ribosomal protein L29 [candidate division KSB1 bacterium]